ncbi:MAG: DJ-1/PfpI family protein [Oscillospiraceae bacterium]|nr:DJ-1/PfpI family protein [Oscillospiraceae bacterium]
MVYMFLGTGFEETEAIAPLDLMRRAGIEVKTVGLNGKIVYGSHGIGVEADILPEEADPSDLEMIVLPGGLGGVASICANAWAMDTLRYAYESGKFIAAICAAPTILAQLGITDGKHATCYPGCEENMGSAKIENAASIRDGKVITGTSAGSATAFGLSLIRVLRGEAAANTVAEQIVIRTQEVTYG